MLGWTFNPKTYFDSPADVRWVSLCAEGAKMYESLLTEQMAFHGNDTQLVPGGFEQLFVRLQRQAGLTTLGNIRTNILRARKAVNMAKTAARFPAPHLPIPSAEEVRARELDIVAGKTAERALLDQLRVLQRHLDRLQGKTPLELDIDRTIGRDELNADMVRAVATNEQASALELGAQALVTYSQRITNNNNAQLWLRLLKQSGLLMSVKQPWATAILECGKRYENRKLPWPGPDKRCAYSKANGARWMLIVASKNAGSATDFRADLERIRYSILNDPDQTDEQKRLSLHKVQTSTGDFKDRGDFPLGGIVGLARVVGCVRNTLGSDAPDSPWFRPACELLPLTFGWEVDKAIAFEHAIPFPGTQTNHRFIGNLKNFEGILQQLVLRLRTVEP